ncbi:unnamed protein product [Ectocarpus sp. CCAP 1310/34]|nr:unnamed protein product [Ectocarpus sp. CCAP 1310/34]
MAMRGITSSRAREGAARSIYVTAILAVLLLFHARASGSAVGATLAASPVAGRVLTAIRSAPQDVADTAVAVVSWQRAARKRRSGGLAGHHGQVATRSFRAARCSRLKMQRSSSSSSVTITANTRVQRLRSRVRHTQAASWYRIFGRRRRAEDTVEPAHGDDSRRAKQAGALGNDSSDETVTKGDTHDKSPEIAARRSRGGGEVHLNFKEALFAGAVSRSIAHTSVHPAIVVKTLMQGRGTSAQLSSLSLKLLSRGAGAQFVMSLPHGAFNYATLEVIMGLSAKFFPADWRETAGPVLDFVTSGVATLLCSVVSTPQVVIEDRIMTGMYPNLVSGFREISRSEGLRGFYTGWSANVSQKIPSYGLTWVFYQASKRLYKKITHRAPTATESFVLGAVAAGGAVCVMLPLDTVLTRVVTQRAQPGFVPYKGAFRTLGRIVKEEGLGAMYSSLPAKLVSVVPAIGIQFGIYDYFRKQLISRKDEDGDDGLLPRDGLLPPSVRRRLGLGNDGRGGDDSDDDFARRMYLAEEELL